MKHHFEYRLVPRRHWRRLDEKERILRRFFSGDARGHLVAVTSQAKAYVNKRTLHSAISGLNPGIVVIQGGHVPAFRFLAGSPESKVREFIPILDEAINGSSRAKA